MPAPGRVPRILIAGPQSGVGKTSITLGILAGLRARGWHPQSFKVGPDFIDPSLHTAVTGRPARNLDSFLNKEAVNRGLFVRASHGSNLAVIEGAMGLFDGYSGRDLRGSSAHMAQILAAPVILVVDASSSSGSIAALVKGFAEFDASIRIAGVILNRVAGRRHLGWLREALSRLRVPVVGHLFFDSDLHLPERHLGLIPAAEKGPDPAWLRRLGRQLQRQIDWDALIKIARSSGELPGVQSDVFPVKQRPRTSIAVARDAAFCFYYQDNLDMLEAFGAELIPFSPLSDSLPEKAEGVYLGGGYPELWAKDLAANRRLRQVLASRARTGFPIYGECGGLMYLGKSLKDFQGRRYDMAGILPYRTEMGSRLKLAYVQVTPKTPALLSAPGEQFPAHVFHFSNLAPDRGLRYHYRLHDGQSPSRDGVMAGNTFASYCHLHFAARPRLAQRFVQACSRWAMMK